MRCQSEIASPTVVLGNLAAIISGVGMTPPILHCDGACSSIRTHTEDIGARFAWPLHAKFQPIPTRNLAVDEATPVANARSSRRTHRVWVTVCSVSGVHRKGPANQTARKSHRPLRGAGYPLQRSHTEIDRCRPMHGSQRRTECRIWSDTTTARGPGCEFALRQGYPQTGARFFQSRRLPPPKTCRDRSRRDRSPGCQNERHDRRPDSISTVRCNRR